jgi:hypothetical protein
MWQETSQRELELPSTRMPSDSVALEATFVRIPAGQAELNTQLWQQIDEQCIPVDQRRRLNDNGFRCGLVGSQMPDRLRQVLDQQQSTPLDQEVQSEMDVLKNSKRVHHRAGRRCEFVTHAPQPNMVVLYREARQQKVGGQVFHDAQCVLASRCYPEGHGGARLELVPEVHHGEPRKQWVASEGTFHPLTGREREVFTDLMIDVQLAPGQTLILSCTDEIKGLGQNFFVEAGPGDAQRKMFLIRLAQTQRDDLFDVDEVDEASPH